MARALQGVLHRNAAASKFTLTQHAPARALREQLEYHWIVRWGLPGATVHEQRVLPNLSTHVVFGTEAAGIWGPARSVFSITLRGSGMALGARVRPGCCAALLGKPATAFAGHCVPLVDALGPSARPATTAANGSVPDAELVGLVNDVLAAGARPLSAAERNARDAVRLLAHDPSITRVGQLAAGTGMTVRTLQRLFAAHVGTSPKWAVRIHRLHDAAARLASDFVPSQTGLAAELGYSDQAHFVRDFTTVVGTPPASYARQQKVTEQVRN
ncbi:AraC family transcriptional regulator [Saccharomonospora piscinae]|uniref:AraC family transcriptional regulator n=1 Tax=Saccharomonospora piscinae TaxID=687388 RepID=UPI000465BA49|nr:helix-turn-helix domain-containing protein [Saccharomonospora piscinae]